MASLATTILPNFIAKRATNKKARVHHVHDVGTVPVESTKSELPANWHRGTFMQIFVRSYQDSKGNGVGDLRGLITRLDYLHDLGVSGLWLMPVMQCADRDHGYAVTNYRAIDPEYGTLADMDELIREAHKRGMGIVLDYVPNHSSVEHPAFLNARKGRAAEYRDWYVWEEKKPKGWSIYDKNPWYSAGGDDFYFAGFWEGMPDFNFHNPEVEAFHHNNLRFWLNRGIDGFRFDAVGNLVENGPEHWEAQPENFDIMERMSAVVHEYENRFVVCEIPGDPYSTRSLDACKHTFAFGHQNNLLAAARGDALALRRVAERFDDKSKDLSRLATFLSNHDGFAGKRVFDQLGGDSASMKLAASLYMLQPGVPFIYYGEEVGMGVGKGLPDDPSLRTPMSWGDCRTGGFTSHTKAYRPHAHNHKTHNVFSQHTDPLSMLSHYKWLCRLRREWRALREGTYEAVQAHNDTLIFRRSFTSDRGESEVVQVVVNVGDREKVVEVGSLPRSAELAPLCHIRHSEGAPLLADHRGYARAKVAARSVMVWGRRFLSKVAIV